MQINREQRVRKNIQIERGGTMKEYRKDRQKDKDRRKSRGVQEKEITKKKSKETQLRFNTILAYLAQWAPEKRQVQYSNGGL